MVHLILTDEQAATVKEALGLFAIRCLDDAHDIWRMRCLGGIEPDRAALLHGRAQERAMAVNRFEQLVLDEIERVQPCPS